MSSPRFDAVKMYSGLTRERERSAEMSARPKGSVGSGRPESNSPYMYSDQLSDYLRMVLLPTVKYRQFCDADDHTDKGLHSGATFTWNVYSKVATKGASLSENAPMPTTKFTITQASGTIVEYGKTLH